MKKIILSILTYFVVWSASAHAVFIETALKGAKGKSHVVKVIYGEPDEHEEVSKWWWYKEGTEVTLTLIKPDGTKESLKTTAKSDHLLTTFIPDQDGVYHVSLHRDTERKEGAKTQYQINAIATVHVGNSVLGNVASNINNELFVYGDKGIYKNNNEVALTLYQQGKPAANSFFQIIAPSGWIRWVKTDEQGVARFVPEWKGKYYAEVSKKEKVEGQSFEEYSRATSMSFDVK